MEQKTVSFYLQKHYAIVKINIVRRYVWISARFIRNNIPGRNYVRGHLENTESRYNWVYVPAGCSRDSKMILISHKPEYYTYYCFTSGCVDRHHIALSLNLLTDGQKITPIFFSLRTKRRRYANLCFSQKFYFQKSIIINGHYSKWPPVTWSWMTIAGNDVGRECETQLLRRSQFKARSPWHCRSKKNIFLHVTPSRAPKHSVRARVLKIKNIPICILSKNKLMFNNYSQFLT